MTKAEQFEALALRCEQATGADRELDAEIWLACVPGATREQTSYFHKASGRECVIDETRDATGRLIIVPSYTASLDAALTLAPADHDWVVGNVNGHVGGTPYACVGSRDQHFAATPALALCAASLRARAAAERGM